jgi:hypothetical protein
MATLDRIEPAYKPWTPSSSGFESASVIDDAEEYVGRHRKPGGRGLGLMRMFYTPRHRAQ